LNARLKSVAAKSITPRFWAALALSALVWLGGLHGAEAGINVWTPIGPFGGNISSLAIDPQNPATLYAAIGDGSSSVQVGVFKSSDGGTTWSAANTGLPSPPAIDQLVIDPQTPTTLYARSFAGGIFKSTDGGGSWSALPSLGILHLAIDPQTPTTLYANGADANGRYGIYKSTDGGGSWTITGLAIRTRSVLAVDPLTPTTLYAASWGDAVNASGIFKSTDGGDSWVTLRTDSVSLLAIDPQTPTTLYEVSSGGVSKSTDGGGTWSGVGPTLTQYDYVRALAIDPQIPTTIYAGTNGSGIFKSTDGGATWSAVATGVRADWGPSGWPGSVVGHPAASLLAIDPRTPSTLYAGLFASGIFKSTDAGGTWRGVGPTLAQVRVLAIDPEIPTTLYVGTNFGGAFKSTDGGGSWGAIAPTGTSVAHLAIDPQTPTTLYAGAYPLSGVYRSADGGQSWGRVNRPGSSAPADIYALAIDPQTPTTLYVNASATNGDGGFFKSTDGGATWSRVWPWLGGVLAVDPQTPTTLYASFRQVELAKSTDAGGSWTTGTSLSSPITCLAIDSRTPTTIYAGTTVYLGTAVAYRGGVFRSTDGGITWSEVIAGLTNLDVRALAIDPQTPTTVYAGTYGGGVFKSTDGGGSWSALNTGLSDLYLSALAIDPQSPATVYAGTRAGVFILQQTSRPSVHTTTVDFDNPPPAGHINGVFEGLDFGWGQWQWSGPYNVDPTNHIYFADSTGTSRSFQFSPGPRVLNGMRVYSTSPGTLTLSDDAGQTFTQAVTTGSLQAVATGWARPSTTVTVSFTNGWDLGVDDITYSTAP
jgi:photosystem II stability/assembly factor-like uncharacterized protein